MQNWAADWTRLDGEACQPNYFEHAWNALEAHYGRRPGGLVRQPNFEVALGLLTGLSNWVRPAPYGQPLRDLVEANGELPGFFSEERLTGADITGFGPSSSVRRQYVTLLVRLAKHMRRQCQARRVNTSPKQVTYRQIMDALCEHFDVGIYNLNYDNVALHACAGAFTGFSDEMDSDGFRHFEPGAVHAREQWGFVYHLHGSVHHTLPSREKGLFDRKMMWQDDLAAPNFCDGEEEGSSVLDERSDRTEIPPTTLVAGGFKLDQLLVEPFHSFH